MASKKDYVIGCKLPNGLKIRGAGKEFTLLGANSSSIINGYGITEGVPADIWEDYEKAHAKSPALVNGLVFATGDRKSAADAAKEREKQKTGLEQATPESAGVKEDKGED
jgi:hypothetical protein